MTFKDGKHGLMSKNKGPGWHQEGQSVSWEEGCQELLGGDRGSGPQSILEKRCSLLI